MHNLQKMHVPPKLRTNTILLMFSQIHWLIKADCFFLINSILLPPRLNMVQEWYIQPQITNLNITCFKIHQQSSAQFSMQCKSAITHKVSYLPNTFLASEGCKIELSIIRVQIMMRVSQEVISLLMISHYPCLYN